MPFAIVRSINWLDLPGDFKQAATQFWSYVKTLIAAPVNFDNSDLSRYLFSNTLGAIQLIPLYIFLVIFVIAIFNKRMRFNGVLSLANVFLFSIFSFVWFFATNVLQNLGNLLRQAVVQIGNVPVPNSLVDKLIPASPIDQTGFVPLILFGLLLNLGFMVFMVVLSYAFLNVILSILGIIAIALVGLGAGPRKFLSFVIALLIVTSLLGVPVILFLAQLAQLFSNIVPGGDDNVTLTLSLIIIGLLAGLVLQPVMVWFAYKRVDRVAAQIIEKVRVTGAVRSLTENKRRSDAFSGRSNPVSYRINQITASAYNAAATKVNTFKNDRLGYGAQQLREMATRTKARHSTETVIERTGKHSTKAAALGTGLSVAAKVAPHPAVKAGAGIAAAGLTALTNKNIKHKPIERRDADADD